MEEKTTRLSLEKILDALTIAVMVTDSKGKTLFRNAACRDLLGRPPVGLAERIEMTCARTRAGDSREKETIGNHTVTSMSMANGMVITEIADNAHMVELKSRLEDSEKRRDDFSVKLSRINLQDCIATSDAMVRAFEKAKQIATYPTTILLVGETGVGKEVMASFIHRNSNRSDKPFIKVNCSAIPDQLLESELFGHESGAFTGAKTNGKAGLFELANGGTILLDEIGDMNYPLQSKLLRVLQEGEVFRLGGQKPIRLDVRVISSTNRDLKKMLEENHFSDALYYRLNVVELYIPALRERRDDIIPLTYFFLDHFCGRYKLEKSISGRVKECFLRYTWPGNIRELRNIVENLVVSSLDRVIDLDDLPRFMTSHSDVPDTRSFTSVKSLQAAVENLQREMIIQSRKKHGSLRKTATALGMDSSTLHRLAKKLDLDREPLE